MIVHRHRRRRRIAIAQVSGVRGADMRGMRVALFVAILATIVEISRAESTRQSLQCKNIARDVIINSCKGPRMKRSPEKFDTSNADQIVKATISGWISRSFFFLYMFLQAYFGFY